MHRSSSNNQPSNRSRLSVLFFAAVLLTNTWVRLSANADSLKPSQRQINCYFVGKSTFDLIASTIYVAVDIHAKNLKGITSEIDNNRLGEELSAQDAAKDILIMHGPDRIAAMYVNSSKIFGSPLAITPQEQQDYPNDHDYQYAEAYLYEANSAVPNDHGVLAAWIKLSQGPDGEWAYHLGQLQSSIEGLKLKHCTPAILSLCANLAARAPHGTPQSISSTLKIVASQTKSGHLTQAALDCLEKSIGDEFGY